MPRMTKVDWELRVHQERQAGIFLGKRIGREEAEKDLATLREQELVTILREGAALAQANAKLTYALQLLVEKASK